jgi:short-subunit dehydrogenase
MKDIANLWALVTGASSGIGREIARELAARGSNVVLVSRSEKALKAFASELEQTSGVKCVVLACDLSVKGEAEKLYRRVVELGLVIDVLVNNAGAGLTTPDEFARPARLESMIRLNMTSLATLSTAFGAEMRSRRRASSSTWPPSSRIFQYPRR